METLRDLPQSVILAAVVILGPALVFVILRALSEGREISFWPPKIGERPNSSTVPVAQDTAPNAKTTPDSVATETIRRSETPDPGESLTDAEDPSAKQVRLPAHPIGLLYIYSGSQHGLCYFITSGERTVTVGRSSDNTLSLNDGVLSRFHFRINISPIELSNSLSRSYQFILIDSRSANGTWVNGAQVLEPTVLKHNDMIEMGEFGMKFYKS
jgi:FHA domain